jgi:hypothetical protein
MTRLILVPHCETSNPQVVRAVHDGNDTVSLPASPPYVCSKTSRRDSDSHLPNRALGEPNIIGHGQNSRPSDKVPSPALRRLNQ